MNLLAKQVKRMKKCTSCGEEKEFAEFYKLNFSKVDFGAYNQGGHGSFAYCLAEGTERTAHCKTYRFICQIHFLHPQFIQYIKYGILYYYSRCDWRYFSRQ